MLTLLRKKKLFHRPMSIGNETYSEREYVLILCQGKAIAELSPLRGLHAENLNQALSQLKTILNQTEDHILLETKDLKLSDLKPSTLFFGLLDNYIEDLKNNHLGNHEIYPSVVFAIESMILNLVDKQKYLAVPICRLDFNNEVGSSDLGLSPCVKIKIGRDKVKRERKKVLEYLKVKNIQLRLDGNNLFNCDELIEFLKDMPIDNIQYIEDPFKNIKELIKYNQKYNEGNLPPVSLDNHIKAELISFECVQFATLKPNFIGGLSKVITLALELKKNNIHSIISSSFETEMGINSLNKLNLQFPNLFFQPPGLDTLRYFKPEINK